MEEELNGNEKKYDLSKSLPTNSIKPNTINSGDLMIWGDTTLPSNDQVVDNPRRSYLRMSGHGGDFFYRS